MDRAGMGRDEGCRRIERGTDGGGCGGDDGKRVLWRCNELDAIE